MELFGDMCLGWHFHATLPGSSEDGPVRESPAGADRIVPTCTSACFAELVANGAKVSSILPAMVSLMGHTDRHGGGTSVKSTCGHFYDSFAPTLALPLRFSVIRS